MFILLIFPLYILMSSLGIYLLYNFLKFRLRDKLSVWLFSISLSLSINFLLILLALRLFLDFNFTTLI